MTYELPVADFEITEAEAWIEMQLAAPKGFREQLGIEVERYGASVALMASRSDNLAINRTLAHGFDAPLTPDVLAAVIERYASRGIDRFLLQWCPLASPRDADPMLRAAGFEPRTRMARMYRRAQPMSLPLNGLELEVVSPRDRETFGMFLVRAHEGPAELASGFSSTIGRPGWRHYFALSAGEPVSGAAVFIRGEIAWCGLAGTVPAARRQGAHLLLLAARVDAAASAGCRWVICDTMEETPAWPNPSFRNMGRAGFETAYLRTNYLYDPGRGPGE